MMMRIGRAVSAVVATMAGLVLLLADPVPAAAAVGERGYWQNANSGLWLTVSGGDGNGSPAVQAPWLNRAAHRWVEVPAGNGNFYLRTDMSSGRVLGIADRSTADLGRAMLWARSTSADQRWSIRRNEYNRFVFVNENSGRCLGVQAASSASNYPVVQFRCNESLDQQWVFVKY